MRLFKKSNTVDRNVNNRFGLAQDKKTKVIWFGYIEPLSNGKFNILDKSHSTGKTIVNGFIRRNNWISVL